jgi:hypothetical protein
MKTKTDTIGGIIMEKPATLADMTAPWLVVGVRGENDRTMCDIICQGTRDECRTFADRVTNQPDLALFIMPVSEWESPDGPFSDTESSLGALAHPPGAANADPNNPLAYSREVERKHALQLFFAALEAAPEGGKDSAQTLIARAFSGCGPEALERRLDAIKPAMFEAFSQSEGNSDDRTAWWENYAQEIRAEHRNLADAITATGHA